jgi:cystathionine beta-lyase/cystathionine gamma-synthase
MRSALGCRPSLLRSRVGIEGVEDLWADLDEVLRVAAKT